MIPSFPSSFVSLFTVLLEYSFAFYFHSLLVVLIWTCPFCRRTFGVWGGEEACYHSKYFPFLHFIPSFTLTAPLLMAVKPPGVKDSILAPAVGTALKAGLFLSLLCVMWPYIKQFSGGFLKTSSYINVLKRLTLLLLLLFIATSNFI